MRSCRNSTGEFPIFSINIEVGDNLTSGESEKQPANGLNSNPKLMLNSPFAGSNLMACFYVT